MAEKKLKNASNGIADIYVDAIGAIEEIRKGNILIVTDDEDRENEGDFIMAAEKVTPQAVNFITLYARGLLCQSITPDTAHRLELPYMVSKNTSVHETAFTVSVDAKKGTTTGISAFDRAVTIKTIVDSASVPDDLCRPGHIFPLIAKKGGVLERDGHTEAAMDLPRLAGLAPSGILCEVIDDDGRMARLPKLEQIAATHSLKIFTVKKLVEYRKKYDNTTAKHSNQFSAADLTNFAEKLAESTLPTRAGKFRIMLFENQRKPDQPNIALISEKSFDKTNALVRIHSECLTGEVLKSVRCDCNEQLEIAMRKTASEGGVIIYLRQEGRGIGLTDKVRSYNLQDSGCDTVEANVKLGHKPDERDYTAAVAILKKLGITGIRLMTNNPDKIEALAATGIKVNERIPVEIKPGNENRSYLETKKIKFGHKLDYV